MAAVKHCRSPTPNARKRSAGIPGTTTHDARPTAAVAKSIATSAFAAKFGHNCPPVRATASPADITDPWAVALSPHRRHRRTLLLRLQCVIDNPRLPVTVSVTTPVFVWRDSTTATIDETFECPSSTAIPGSR